MAKVHDENPFRDFLYSDSIERLSKKCGVTMRTLSLWRSGQKMPLHENRNVIRKLSKGRVSVLDIAIYRYQKFNNI